MAFGKKKTENFEESEERKELRANLSKAIDNVVEKEKTEIDDDEDESLKIKRARKTDVRPALHTGEDALKGDRVDYSTFQEIIKNAIHPPDIKGKIKLYMPYIITFSLIMSLFVAAFWDAIMVRGRPNWVLGIAVMLFPMFFMYFYIIEIKDKKDVRFPKWSDVNSGFVFRYQKLGEVDGYLFVTIFAVHHQRVYQPRNPYGDGTLIKIAIDKNCVYENNEGMVTTGVPHFDLTGRSTFRIEKDPDFVPNPSIHRLLFQLSIAETKLLTEREYQFELRKKLDGIKRLVIEEEIDYVTKIVRKFLPIMTIMVKSKEMDLASEVAWADLLSRHNIDPKKYKSSEDKSLIDAMKREALGHGGE